MTSVTWAPNLCRRGTNSPAAAIASRKKYAFPLQFDGKLVDQGCSGSAWPAWLTLKPASCAASVVALPTAATRRDTGVAWFADEERFVATLGMTA